MNLSIYGFGDGRRRQWLIVDCGVSFASEEHLPGVDLILPDIRYLIEERKNIVGLVLTHGHEDHIGALIDLWPRLNVPIYATPFTAALFEAKRARRARRAANSGQCRAVAADTLTLGPFAVEFINVAHSIPESNALAIRTPAGIVLHTGDWKIDPTPLLGSRHRCGAADRARRRGRARARRRFHQRGPRRPLALGSRRGQDHRRTRPHRAGPRGGDDVCLPRRPHPRRGRRRARRRPRGRPGRPRHGAGRPGGARDRLSRRRAGFPQRRELRLPAARQGLGAVHRQPGRAARGAGAHRRGRASRSHARQAATG